MASLGENLTFRWAPCADGARLLRVYGDTPCPALPSRLAGRPLTEIAPYCFAASPRAGRAGALWAAPGAGGAAVPDASHPLCGDFLTDVRLPASVRVLDSAVFYNCRSLRSLTVGPAIETLGSDLFTNCGALADLYVTAQPGSPTGLKKLLSALTADITVHFLAPDEQARLFYPEYFEWLDENTPAHIFNHSIEGEGYRYRQCFDGGRQLFAEYDAAFSQAAVGETPAKLCRLALGRLRFPCALTAEAQAAYRGWLADHLPDALSFILDARDAGALGWLCGSGLPDAALLAQGAARCGRLGWTEGAALLLNAAACRKRTPRRYDFD